MALVLPSTTKTWRFLVNQTVAQTGASSSMGPAYLMAVKNGLLGFSGTWTDNLGIASTYANPWTIVLSAGRLNGLGAAGVDQWTTTSQIVWSGSGNRTWMLIQNVDGCQLLLSTPLTTDTSQLNISFSAGGLFTGGSATVLPTATDQVNLMTGSSGTSVLGYGGSTSDNFQFHILHSSDGQCTRFFTTAAGVCTFTMHVERIKNPKASIVIPTVAGVVWNNSSTPTQHAITGSSGFLAGSGANIWLRHSATNCRVSYTCEGAATGLLCQSHLGQSDFDGSWPALPLGIFGYTVNGRGRVGEVHDVWAPSFSNFTGDTFPDAGGPGAERQFIQMGSLLYPWNRSAPLVSG